MPKLELVKLKDITVPDRYRKDYGNIEELVENVKEKGILQPISLNANLELAAGGRRFVAATLAELTEIPAMIQDGNEELDRLEIELFENIFRKDMTWPEESALTEAINELYLSKHGKNWSGRKTAGVLGKSIGMVSENLLLSKAVKAMPELKKCKTRKDALKVIKKTVRNEEVKVAVKKQAEEMNHPNMDILRIADANFEIQDCFLGMEELDEYYKKNKIKSKINFVEVDPPYAIDLNEIKKQEGITDAELKIYKEISKEKYPSFLNRTCELIYRTTADNTWVIFWFGPTWFTEVKYALESAGFTVDDIPAIWVKGDKDSEGTGQTNQPSIYLARAYEPFFIARKGSPKIQQEGRSNIFYHKPVPPAQKYHPTQRPIELIQDIIDTFCYPTDITMIPFLGSGTTLLALYSRNMKGFGWELNKSNKDHFLLEVGKNAG